MRMTYFGDSYDFVKLSLLRCLRELGPWAVLPMFTETEDTDRANELRLFLGVPIISTEVLTNENRSSYFNTAATAQHLFIDPNTGLRLSKIGGKKALDYLFASELLDVTEHRPENLTMVFDQSLGRAAENARKAEVKGKLHSLRERGLFGFAYYSHACFLVLSKDQPVVNDARERVNQGLGLPSSRLVDC
jgi:hypothetical protein